MERLRGAGFSGEWAGINANLGDFEDEGGSGVTRWALPGQGREPAAPSLFFERRRVEMDAEGHGFWEAWSGGGTKLTEWTKFLGRGVIRRGIQRGEGGWRSLAPASQRLPEDNLFIVSAIE